MRQLACNKRFICKHGKVYEGSPTPKEERAYVFGKNPKSNFKRNVNGKMSSNKNCKNKIITQKDVTLINKIRTQKDVTIIKKNWHTKENWHKKLNVYILCLELLECEDLVRDECKTK